LHQKVQLPAPTPLSGAGSVFHPQPMLSVLDYSSLFVFFSFAGGRGVQSTWELCWIVFLGGWVGESHVVHDAHLYREK
jgi:hypothetical protein